MMHGRGKSDGPIVPAKQSNKAASAAAETVEERGPAKGNMSKQNASRTQSRMDGRPSLDASSALDRVRVAARKDKTLRFTSLFHHVNIDRLRSAFYALKRKAAPGVDDVTWEQYHEKLEKNLGNLHGRLHRGAYRAKPTRRVFIPKADGRQRPLGIAALEDKIVQVAVAEVLNAIYEVDFLGFSYGFRPGRSTHQALDALAVGIKRKRVNWVFDCDIRGFFDAMDRSWIERFLEHRIGDKRILRLIGKWLRVGVVEEGIRSFMETGSVQGAPISPLLANIYLHYAFDLWVKRWREKRAVGDMIVVRYADDIVAGFQRRSDARQFHNELEVRMREFGLELHPEKTRLIQFGRRAPALRKRAGLGRPETFNFLGFTHICGKSRKGRFLLYRRTIKKRMSSSLRRTKTELLKRRHEPLDDQGRWLRRVVQGHYAYYGVPTNSDQLVTFRNQVIRHWYRALKRRSHRRKITWDRMNVLARKWIPRPRIQHPWPSVRFDARTQGRSPVR